MTLDAVIANDDELLFKAFLSDPLMHIGRKEARKLFDEMLVASALRY
jgi:alpha-galactosidase